MNLSSDKDALAVIIIPDCGDLGRVSDVIVDSAIIPSSRASSVGRYCTSPALDFSDIFVIRPLEIGSDKLRCTPLDFGDPSIDCSSEGVNGRGPPEESMACSAHLAKVDLWAGVMFRVVI